MQALVTDLLELSPKLIIMVGVSGGVKSRVKEGDVVMARQVYNYEPAKDTAEGFLPRHQIYRCSGILTDLANALHADGQFDTALDGGRLHTDKDWASGEKVLLNPESDVRKQIENASIDIIAFETEGHGMLHPIWERDRKLGKAIPVGVIKTVTDCGDDQMTIDKETKQRNGTLRSLRVAITLATHLHRVKFFAAN
jgi:nucleoside phosphorylase